MAGLVVLSTADILQRPQRTSPLHNVQGSRRERFPRRKAREAFTRVLPRIRGRGKRLAIVAIVHLTRGRADRSCALLGAWGSERPRRSGRMPVFAVVWGREVQLIAHGGFWGIHVPSVDDVAVGFGDFRIGARCIVLGGPDGTVGCVGASEVCA